MPFAAHRRPSLQIGLLSAIARRHGYPVLTFHFNIDFAATIGEALYTFLSEHRGHQLGDWLFAEVAFGSASPDPDLTFLTDFPVAEWSERRSELERIRRVVAPAFIACLAESVAWEHFRIVGFTSTFQQSVASLALARIIKQRHPDILTVFGGANFDDSMGMEYMRAFPVIDYAVAGEGDLAFPALLQALLENQDPATVPGVLSRKGEKVQQGPQLSLIRDLDALPTPEYDEFFERAEKRGLLPVTARRAVDLPFESARGCWWGEKHQCTFCGLNSSGMTYRAKSAPRVQAELRELTARYRSFQVEAVDNILSMSLLRDLFPALSAQEADYQFFYEVKANLSRQQLRTMARGGVYRIQPGIESLSSAVLRIMDKGVRGIQNVNVLRWATYYGIDVAWNLLWGFPGEAVEDYEVQLALLPSLMHLPPPGGGGRIWMERFSPLYQKMLESREGWMRAEKSYSYVFPNDVNLDRIAYFFDYELPGTAHHADPVFKRTDDQIREWQRRWAVNPRPSLQYRSAPGFAQIDDLRDTESPAIYTLVDPLASMYVYCSDKPHNPTRVVADLGLTLTSGVVEKALDRLCEQGLMMRDGDLFLSLALPATGGR